jgi:aryl-alcohol dehydrogenase-like predicted oxidoreductase
LEYCNFGQTELRPSVIGFGCGRIASLSTSHHRKEILATLHAALDSGINFFDTADSYGQGDSERLLGEIFRRQRGRILICTKAGYRFGGFRRVALWAKPLAKRVMSRSTSARSIAAGMRSRPLPQNFDPAYITSAVEGSLRRLRTEHIDLFLLHSPPPHTIADGTILDALDRLKSKGLIRYYGVSCGSDKDALLCLRDPRIAVLQVPGNLLGIGTLEKLLELTASKRVATVVRQPFAQENLLTHPTLLEFVAKHPGRTPAQTALRFVLQLRGVGVVLIGTTSRSHLVENLGAVTAPPLTSDEMEGLYGLTNMNTKEVVA